MDTTIQELLSDSTSHDKVQVLLKDINQLSIDIDNAEDSKRKKVLKAYAELKIRMLTGYIKGL